MALTTGFLRVYRDAAGEIRTETLLSIDKLGLPPRLVTTENGVREERPHITGFAMDADGSEIVVSVCVRGWYSDGGLFGWNADAETALFRSTDGGVTWQEFGELGQGGGVRGLVGEGEALAFTYETPLAPATFSLFPGGDPVEPPGGTGQRWPQVLPGGEIIWLTDDGRLLRGDGSEFVALPGSVRLSRFRSAILRDPGSERFALLWRAEQDVRHLGLFERDGRITEVFSLPYSLFLVGPWLGPRLLAGSTDVSPDQLMSPVPSAFRGILPALIDLDAGLVHPIADPFLAAGFPGGRSFIRAAVQGPFARVDVPESCLNVRAEPGLGSEILDCAADGVLLRDSGETRNLDGDVWLGVVTPAGLEGWASARFLER